MIAVAHHSRGPSWPQDADFDTLFGDFVTTDLHSGGAEWPLAGQHDPAGGHNDQDNGHSSTRISHSSERSTQVYPVTPTRTSRWLPSDTSAFPSTPDASPSKSILEEQRGRKRTISKKGSMRGMRSQSGIRKSLRHAKSTPSLSEAAKWKEGLFGDGNRQVPPRPLPIPPLPPVPHISNDGPENARLSLFPDAMQFDPFASSGMFARLHISDTTTQCDQISTAMLRHQTSCYALPSTHQTFFETNATPAHADIPSNSFSTPLYHTGEIPINTGLPSPPSSDLLVPHALLNSTSLYPRHFSPPSSSPAPLFNPDFTFNPPPSISTPIEPSVSPSTPQAPNFSRPSRFTGRHRRTRSSPPSDTQGGFVNFTPQDAGRLLSGVAPSGSSKTRARRDKEEVDARKRIGLAAVRAVREGDLAALREVGIDVVEGFDADEGMEEEF